MKFHMLMLMNAWMMLVLMKCKCQMQCLTLGCYSLVILTACQVAGSVAWACVRADTIVLRPIMCYCV